MSRSSQHAPSPCASLAHSPFYIGPAALVSQWATIVQLLALFSPSAKIPPFRTGKEHLGQPPSALASPFPSSLPNYYHLSIGLSSVLCLLKLNKTFFHGDRMWGGNHLLHCPLTCYRRLQTPLSSPVLCAKHRLPALFPSGMPSEKQTNAFQTLINMVKQARILQRQGKRQKAHQMSSIFV